MSTERLRSGFQMSNHEMHTVHMHENKKLRDISTTAMLDSFFANDGQKTTHFLIKTQSFHTMLVGTVVFPHNCDYYAVLDTHKHII